MIIFLFFQHHNHNITNKLNSRGEYETFSFYVCNCMHQICMHHMFSCRFVPQNYCLFIWDMSFHLFHGDEQKKGEHIGHFFFLLYNVYVDKNQWKKKEKTWWLGKVGSILWVGFSLDGEDSWFRSSLIFKILIYKQAFESFQLLTKKLSI